MISPTDQSPRPCQVILVLDDDRSFRIALADTLREDGFDVRDYPDPTQVPSLDGLAPIDALVTDYRMPAIDGLAFADRFHRAHPLAPIVLISSDSGQALDDQVAARPHVQFMRKPIDYGALLELLQR